MSRAPWLLITFSTGAVLLVTCWIALVVLGGVVALWASAVLLIACAATKLAVEELRDWKAER